MLALLSPAKKLAFPEESSDLPCSKPQFARDAGALVKVARKLSARDLASLMKLSASLAELNAERFQSFVSSPQPPRARQAILAYRGDTYQGLDADSLSEEDLHYAQDHLRILSGLYGLLRPFDLIQPYRLEMKTPLANGKGKDLYAYWGDRLAGAVDAAAGGAPVVNLASGEYWKAVGTKALESRVITPVFKEVKDGVPKVIGLFAKRARGMMARFMVVNRMEDPEGLKEFAEGGYSFQASLSEGDVWVFTRPS